MLCNFDDENYCYNCYKSIVVDNDPDDDINRNVDIKTKSSESDIYILFLWILFNCRGIIFKNLNE